MFSLKKKLYTAYVSKHNSKYGKKIVPLMFDKEVWYYLQANILIRSINALIREIT